MSRFALIALLAAAMPASALSWSSVAAPKKGFKNNGPIETASAGGGKNLALLFGGWTGTAPAVKAWAEGLAGPAKPSLKEFGVGGLYSIPGPFDSGYGRREHDFDKLVAAVAADADKRGTKLIIVAAHSSGAFVADAFLGALAKKRADLVPKTVVYKLDGGFSGGDVKPALWAKVGALYCVAAKCDKVTSRNYYGMTGGCKGPSGNKAKTITVAAAGTGCKSPNCCHDALINSKPHNPNTFAVVKDYSDYSGGRRTVSDWLKQSSAALQGIAGK